MSTLFVGGILSEVLEEEGIQGTEDAVREISAALTPSFATALHDVLRTRGTPPDGFKVYGADSIVSLLWRLAPDLDMSGGVSELHLTAGEIRSELEQYVLERITSEDPIVIEEVTATLLGKFGIDYEGLNDGERHRWTMGVIDLFTVVTYKYMHDAVLQYEGEEADGTPHSAASYKLNNEDYWDAISPLQDDGLVPIRIDSLGALCEYFAKLKGGNNRSQRRAEKILSALEPVEDLYQITVDLAKVLRTTGLEELWHHLIRSLDRSQRLFMSF